jgi:hypothetical protein
MIDAGIANPSGNGISEGAVTLAKFAMAGTRDC